MQKASWVFLLAVSLLLTAGCKKDELRAKDARIAELQEMTGDKSAKLDQISASVTWKKLARPFRPT